MFQGQRPLPDSPLCSPNTGTFSFKLVSLWGETLAQPGDHGLFWTNPPRRMGYCEGPQVPGVEVNRRRGESGKLEHQVNNLILWGLLLPASRKWLRVLVTRFIF